MNAKNTPNTLFNFLDNSPTAWHAVKNCKTELEQHGFKELHENENWHLKPGGNYFVSRNGSSICAFTLSQKKPQSIRVAASHTDSPALKLKPNAEFYKENMLMLGLEIYGGPLLASWLNRDLGIAGRILFTDKKGNIHEELVNIDQTPIVIPQLAIHLDRNVNESGPILNKQEHLAAIAAIQPKPEKEKDSFLLRQIKAQLPTLQQLLSYDLFAYPLEKACLIGENHEMFASYRIDSLASVHSALQAFLQKPKPAQESIKMAVFWDNEEIGSNTAQGAGSPFLPHIIERITLALGMTREDYFRLLSASLCASVDLAHALHPNYADKHEPRHLAIMNKGIVIKSNAQQRYATDARSAATIVALCQKHNIPFQAYISRGDIACGSTIGPITANLTGMPTVDIGCTQLSMHSCRELAGIHDQASMTQLLATFLHE